MYILPVILCGGSGTRLWPLSREQYPKQLLPLLGDTSLLQSTLNRVTVEALPPDSKLLSPMVISNAEYRFLVAEQLRQSGVEAHIVLEPCGRNTAPALTVATLLTLQSMPEDSEAHAPLLVVMPADHAIGDMSAFQDALRQALLFATMGKVVTLGVIPSGPETGFGYIREGAALVGECHEIAAFVEKPDEATARSYLDSGDYLWNSGIFVLSASVWLEQIKLHRPEILAACEKAVAGSKVGCDFTHLQAEAFAACPSDSIDYAIMERLTGASGVVVPLDANWSDVGSWDALWEMGDKDDNGNVIQGDVLALDSQSCYLRSGHRLVACVGLKDAVVVETPDAILVAHRDHLQSLRTVVAQLKQEKRPEADNHRKVFRPWGHYDSIDTGDGFQVKRIVVDPGAALSLQMHHHRAEHWIVVRGTAKVTIGDTERLLSENQSTHIPLGTIHRLENPGRIPLEMIEVQSGSYLGEDDIVRFEDSYGRNCKNQ